MQPFVLFENIYEDGTVSASTEASGYVAENVYDWRTMTAYRWKASGTASPFWVKVDLGAGITAHPDTVAVGGHNLNTISASVKMQYSDNDADWTDAFSAVTPSDDAPLCEAFSGTGSHRYWRFYGSGTLSAAPQIGVLTLGRRLEFYGLPADLDIYGWESVLDEATNRNGSAIGANLRYVRKEFALNYGPPGQEVAAFFDPSTGLGWDDDFVPHARAGDPFWFCWNLDSAPSEVYLCRVNGRCGNPFVGTTKRREIHLPIVATQDWLT